MPLSKPPYTKTPQYHNSLGALLKKHNDKRYRERIKKLFEAELMRLEQDLSENGLREIKNYFEDKSAYKKKELWSLRVGFYGHRAVLVAEMEPNEWHFAGDHEDYERYLNKWREG